MMTVPVQSLSSPVFRINFTGSFSCVVSGILCLLHGHSVGVIL